MQLHNYTTIYFATKFYSTILGISHFHWMSWYLEKAYKPLMIESSSKDNRIKCYQYAAAWEDSEMNTLFPV